MGEFDKYFDFIEELARRCRECSDNLTPILRSFRHVLAVLEHFTGLRLLLLVSLNFSLSS
jgi:hypothetical protein